MKGDVLRCRATGAPRHIWSRQCPNTAKTERVLVMGDEPVVVCGVHARARYVYEYRPSPESKYQQPVAVTKEGR